MTKNELKTGMWVKTRSGSYWMIFKGINGVEPDAMVDIHGEWMPISYDMQDDMTYDGAPISYDIEEVYAPTHICKINKPPNTEGFNHKLIWSRGQKTELTIAQIEEKLGYSIKVVK